MLQIEHRCSENFTAEQYQKYLDDTHQQHGSDKHRIGIYAGKEIDPVCPCVKAVKYSRKNKKREKGCHKVITAVIKPEYPLSEGKL